MYVCINKVKNVKKEPTYLYKRNVMGLTQLERKTLKIRELCN